MNDTIPMDAAILSSRVEYLLYQLELGLEVIAASEEFMQAINNADACPPKNECYAECHSVAEECGTRLDAALEKWRSAAPLKVIS